VHRSVTAFTLTPAVTQLHGENSGYSQRVLYTAGSCRMYMTVKEMPARLCRICTQPVSNCTCGAVLCLWCLGPEDTATCTHCNGDGVSTPERVSVVPDEDAQAIREYLRANPGLQKEVYVREDADPLRGLCYPAAEAYYHVTDCRMDVYCLSWNDVSPDKSGTHWYLRDPDSAEFVDLGLPFEAGVTLPPFETGRRRGFITGDSPSKRAQQVLDDLQKQ